MYIYIVIYRYADFIKHGLISFNFFNNKLKSYMYNANNLILS